MQLDSAPARPINPRLRHPPPLHQTTASSPQTTLAHATADQRRPSRLRSPGRAAEAERARQSSFPRCLAASNSNLPAVASLPLRSIAMASSGDAPGSTGERLLASIGRICSDLSLAWTIKSKLSSFFQRSWCGSFILSRICFMCAESVGPIRSPVARFGARASSISLLAGLGLSLR